MSRRNREKKKKKVNDENVFKNTKKIYKQQQKLWL